MKILQVHNKYQQMGGEDTVVEAEYRLLKSQGHEVHQWFESSIEITGYSWWKKAMLPFSFCWSFKSYRKMEMRIREVKPDIVHVHNTVPLITPSIYYACKKRQVPVVQTLHNYRLFCANGMLFREGKICEKCIHKKIPFYAVRYSCYRSSKLQSLIMSMHLWLHQKVRTYPKQISIYIALTSFAKKKHILGGIPKEKVVIKPNVLSYNGEIGPHNGNNALFVGRLVGEKGVQTLVEAWKQIGSGLPLKIIGSGPLEESLKSSVPEGVTLLGHRNREFILEEMKQAKVLIFPSQCYEGFPMTLLEAFSVGLPVIAGALGGLQEIVQKNLGWLFESGSSQDLIAKVQEVLKLSDSCYSTMSRGIVQHYQEHYGKEVNYKMLMEIYQKAMNRK